VNDAEELVVGRNAVHEALRSDESIREVLLAEESGRRGIVAQIEAAARERGVPVRSVPRAALDRLARSTRHQGVAARMSEYRYGDIETIEAAALRRSEPALILALDEVQDVHNLGSLIRTAEAVGAHGLLIPDRRAAPITAAVRKASAGAVAHMAVARGNLPDMLDRLRSRGMSTVGLDGGGTVAWTDVDLTQPVVIVVGGEGRGLRRVVQRRCDVLAYLPMHGRIGSLNAAVAGSIVLYEALRQRGAM